MTPSDLHLSVGSAPIVRINGLLERLDYPRLSANDTRELIYSILSQDQRQRLENEWEIEFSYSVPGRARFRVNAYFQRNSLGAAFRLIPIAIKKLDELGLPRALHDMTLKPRGFCVVTGPTGSGKSTTLAAMIDEINETRDEHIVTIEDPIEFLHGHKKCRVTQREVASTRRVSTGPESVLRQDPDIILVGEMRDIETIPGPHGGRDRPPCLRHAAHHDAPQTIDRIIDVFPPHQQEQIRVQLSTTLMGVCTQQLLPTRDGRGRCVACELLIPTPAVRNLIREGKTHQIYSMMQTGTQFGMQTMDAALADLVRRGIISRELAKNRSSTPAEFERLLEPRGGQRALTGWQESKAVPINGEQRKVPHQWVAGGAGGRKGVRKAYEHVCQ